MGTKSWPGGVVRKTPVTPAGPYQNGTASGLWTMERVAFWKKQGLWPTAGNVDPSSYIENIFSTYLYTGNGSTQTITNGIDLSGKGGLVWLKSRSNTIGHTLFDTNRGANKSLFTNATLAEFTYTQVLNSFTSSGFTLGSDLGNTNTYTYASWTFRKQAKFFDVVTYAGDGTSGRTIAHNLQSAPGFIAIKAYSGSGASTYNWICYHRSLGTGSWIELNLTSAKQDFAGLWTNTNSSTFDASSLLSLNDSGKSYVAYLFAHNAGGFGATGSDNVVSCGTFQSVGNNIITLGYEPQWVLVKRTDAGVGNWYLLDTMRGLTNYASFNDRAMYANSNGAELPAGGEFGLLSNGFYAAITSGTYIYIAIRRGPMKTPTSGTSVFSLAARTGTGSTASVTGVGFPPDLAMVNQRTQVSGNSTAFRDKLRGPNPVIFSGFTNAESTAYTNGITSFDQDGISVGADTNDTANFSGRTYINYFLRRAPGFFDVVCFTTDGGTDQRVTHNLTVAPELIITRRRDAAGNWFTYSATLGRSGYVSLNSTNANNSGFSDVWGTTNPTSTDFGFNTQIFTNSPYTGRTIVAYLFATLAGVSKVGSYTGTGTTLQVDCGFTAGARFVMIKRTDSTGDWYVWDTTRGIVAGNDPYLLLNSNAAEVTNTDYIDPYSPGFEISSTAPAGINASGGTYIFLAIA